VPKRKRATFDLDSKPEPEAMSHAFAPGFTVGWGEDEYLQIPEAKREAHIVAQFDGEGIAKIHAANHLGDDALRDLALRSRPEVVAHYGILDMLLSRRGWEAWDVLTQFYERAPYAAIQVLVRIDSVVVGRFLAERCFHKDRATANACRARFERYVAAQPVAAIAGLIPLVVGADAKIHNKALKLLRRVHEQMGLSRAIAEAAARYGSGVADEVSTLLGPQPLPPRAPKMPAWWSPADLPTLRLADGSPLEGESLELLGNLMALLPSPAARAALDEVAPRLDRESFDAFADALIAAWVQGGGKPKDKWAIYAMGALGDEQSARRLVDLAKRFQEEGLHRRSAIALEAVASMGSDVALLRLSELTRLKGALKKRAAKILAAHADEMGWSDDELADRLVPRLGLDDDGSRVLSFGPRSFRVGFDAFLRPYVVDDEGNRRDRLPRPGKNDDGELAERSAKLFADLRKDAKTVGKRQAERLERAMVAGRRWPTERWRQLFIDHPLAIHFARRLVFAAFDASGKLVASFRVAEDRSLADSSDDAFELPEEVASIGIAHPLELGTTLTARWGDVLTDYEILQPFAQLSRPVFEATEDELRSTTIRRFVGQRAEGKRFFTLKARGWDFPDYDIGKRLPGGYVALLRTEPGLDFLGYRPDEQTLGELYLTVEGGGKAHFSDLSAVSMSEIFYDVSLLS
jgi:hypothetical protein